MTRVALGGLIFALGVLYVALTLGANDTAVATYDSAKLAALRTGDMRKLVVHSAPKELPDHVFLDGDRAETDLAAYRGSVVVLNFWATWCAPCRAEMPSLDALQAELGGDDLEVVAIASGRNPLPVIKQFFADGNIEYLAIHLDPKQTVTRSFGVLGLPATLIIDRDGREIARMIGDAEWNGEDAIAFLRGVTSEVSNAD